MLMAHPTVLRNLVERYEALRALADRRGEDTADGGGAVDPQIHRQLQDTVYTLCVSTGTRDIAPALAAAREHMERYVFTERGELDESAA
jgi:hypothetical protein